MFAQLLSEISSHWGCNHFCHFCVCNNSFVWEMNAKMFHLFYILNTIQCRSTKCTSIVMISARFSNCKRIICEYNLLHKFELLFLSSKPNNPIMKENWLQWSGSFHHTVVWRRFSIYGSLASIFRCSRLLYILLSLSMSLYINCFLIYTCFPDLFYIQLVVICSNLISVKFTIILISYLFLMQ